MAGDEEVDMSNPNDRLQEFKTTFESGAPPYNASSGVVALMHRATAELKASGIEGRASESATMRRRLRYLIKTT
jgi:hypothetical protein